MIYLGADHRGYKLKEEIKKFLTKTGYDFKDLGVNSNEPADYPLIAEKVGRSVAENKNNRGILICGSGGGVCIAANKIRGIRAAEARDEDKAKADRNDDDVNILCLSGDWLDLDAAKPIIEVFLNTRFDSAERRVRRLRQIAALEEN